jgi:aminoglycoside phosphotransferase (APT) family kinase protein
MIASPTTIASVSEVLREYLQLRLGIGDLEYLTPPSPSNEGWETYIYRFQLRSDDGLSPELNRPLILRVYSSMNGLPRLQHEVAVQQHLHARGYPVAWPLLVEETDNVLGGPFMIMELLPGRTLLDELFRRFWRMAHAPVEMAEMHARLHRLPVDGFPAPDGEFLARQFQMMHNLIEEYNQDSLRAGLDWLEEHRPPAPTTPCILHLDFHPINMLCRWRQCTGVLDWGDADVGDRHADVAYSLVLMRSAPIQIGKTLWQRFTSLPGRWLFRKYYLHAYRNRVPLDEQTLAYYEAWAALHRLCRRGMWLSTSPKFNGHKPAFLRYVTWERENRLVECFRRVSGITLKIPGFRSVLSRQKLQSLATSP